MEPLLRSLRQPEYVHVLLNPLPVYGLLLSLIGLIIAFVLKSRRAQIATLALVLISSLCAWPVYEYGEDGYDRVLAMTDDDGHAWLDEHLRRADAGGRIRHREFRNEPAPPIRAEQDEH